MQNSAKWIIFNHLFIYLLLNLKAFAHFTTTMYTGFHNEYVYWSQWDRADRHSAHESTCNCYRN